MLLPLLRFSPAGFVNRNYNRRGEGWGDSSRLLSLGGGILAKRNWPPWWEWELEFTPHLLKRMADRRFTEVDLQRMLEKATDSRRDILEGRWAIRTRHRSRPWEVIVEPDFAARILIVITAYPWEPREP